jgi:Eukaryotic protein of unknown function (DUF1764)
MSKRKLIQVTPQTKSLSVTVTNKTTGSEPSSTALTIQETKGLSDIDALFDSKKKQKQNIKAVAETDAKKQRSAPTISLNYDRSDTAKLKPREWADDGLGGKFNQEGFTGRKEQGVNVYKAHLFNKRDFGKTVDCPFDCDCCFI